MDIPVIVITGGPCSGKTTLLATIEHDLATHGMHTIVVSEVATELIRAGITPALMGNDAFQRHLIRYSMEREAAYLKMAAALPQRKPVLLCDRGILDGFAYMPAYEFEAVLQEVGLTRADALARYTMAIHMVTAAEGAEAHYTLANNAARSETADQARALDALTKHAWIGHDNLAVIDNSTDFEGKKQRAVASLRRILAMPEPLTRQRKFLVETLASGMLPSHTQSAKLTQTYLRAPIGSERRIRRRVMNGVSRFSYTEKYPVPGTFESIIRERIIGQTEYFALLSTDRHSKRTSIEKVRHYFVHDNRYFKLDIFGGRHEGLILLEAEVVDLKEEVVLPPDIVAREVTHDSQYSNYVLALRS